MKPKKKKNNYYPPYGNYPYDPFDFHHQKQTDFYGEYHFQNGRKIYTYCFDARFETRLGCRPQRPQMQNVWSNHDHYKPQYQIHHFHHYDGDYRENTGTGQYLGGENSNVRKNIQQNSNISDPFIYILE